MTDEISQVVEVYISRETAQIDTASFDIPLILVNLPDVVDNTDPENPVNTPADVTDRVQEFRSATAVGEEFGTSSTAYIMAQKLMGNPVKPARFMVGVKNSSETYTEAVNACLAYNDDWYAIMIDSKTSADILAVAAVIQAERRVFGASTADLAVTDPASTDDVGSMLRDGGFDRTFLVYATRAVSEHPEVAWVGGQISAVPGSNTWNFKSGAGVTVDKLSATQVSALDDKNVNYYTRLGGVNMFRTGTTSQGEWIDVIIGLDWVQARLQEQIFFRLATKKKVPMTQEGAAIIEAEIRHVLSQGEQNGLIATAPKYVVRSPEVLNIPEIQRNQRVMGDFFFEFRLAGAVHKVIVRGTVTA